MRRRKKRSQKFPKQYTGKSGRRLGKRVICTIQSLPAVSEILSEPEEVRKKCSINIAASSIRRAKREIEIKRLVHQRGKRCKFFLHRCEDKKVKNILITDCFIGGHEGVLCTSINFIRSISIFTVSPFQRVMDGVDYEIFVL